MAALEAGGLQTFFQTGLDAAQARNAHTDHCHLLNHAGLRTESLESWELRAGVRRNGQRVNKWWEAVSFWLREACPLFQSNWLTVKLFDSIKDNYIQSDDLKKN